MDLLNTTTWNSNSSIFTTGPLEKTLFRVITLLSLIVLISFVGPSDKRPVDHGGRINDYADRISEYNSTGAMKRIYGDCVSACTMYLAISNKCIVRGSRLWFHAAFTKGPTGPAVSPKGNRELMSFYPAQVQRWVLDSGALQSLPIRKKNSLSAEQLVNMGVIRYCR